VPRSRTARGREFLPGEGSVRDALLALGLAAARRHRNRLSGPTFIGVTGSVGKTTTKELVAAVLGGEGAGTKTPGSRNQLNLVGRTILQTRQRHAFSVHEVPAWRPGSVREIAALIRPDIAAVTRIGSDHRRVFRTLEATAAEKRALVEALPPDGVAVLNADDPHVLAMANAFPGRVITFGAAADATLRADDVRSSWPDRLTFTLRAEGRAFPVRTQLNGRFWIASVLAAVGVGVALDVPLDRALAAVASVEPVTGRMSVVEQGGVTFVRDDTKAPRWSLDATFEFLAEARAARKVLVLGTISDYPGSMSATYSRTAARALEVADEVAFVGPNSRHALKAGSDSLSAFATVREAAEHFRTTLRDGDLVLLKGSVRADHLSRIALNRVSEVRCWRTSCGRVSFCEDCRLLYGRFAPPV
jgi:UDP-N-acetylmuramoyl-tripeptide--D-alanyl-D-alanine ligase